MARKYKIGEAAELLGVSADTVRRWADAGTLRLSRTAGRQRLIDGADLAAFLSSRSGRKDTNLSAASTRNRLPGIVTRVVKDKVAAQVEVQVGPNRMVALITRESADELKLSPGSMVVASVKSTNVTLEVPG